MTDTITIDGAEYEVIRRFPGDCQNGEIAIIRDASATGGIRICGKLFGAWYGELNERGAVRALLAECDAWKKKYAQAMEQHGFKRSEI